MDANSLTNPGEVPWSYFVEAFSSFRDDHLAILNDCTSGEHVPIDSVRHLVMAALRRSAALIDGLLILVDGRNRFAAVPLVRLQVDSAMRVHACSLVSDCDDFVGHILRGGEPRKYKKVAHNFSDKNLHTLLTDKYPYTSDIYQETNGYVHLSKNHLFGVFDQDLLKRNEIKLTEHDLLPPWDEADVKGTMMTMLWATEVLTEECKALTKQHPK